MTKPFETPRPSRNNLITGSIFGAAKAMEQTAGLLSELQDTNVDAPDVLRQIANIHVISAHREQLENRMNHTINWLKKKNLYADTFDGVLDVCERHHLDDAYQDISHISIISGGILEVDKSVIPDNIWKGAIELTMAQREPNVFLSPDIPYPSTLKLHLRELYSTVMLLNATAGVEAHVTERNAYYADMNTARDALMDIINKECGGIENLPAFLNASRAKIEDLKDVMNEYADEREKAVRREYSDAIKQTSEKLKQADAERHNAERIIRDLKEQIESLSQELQEKNEALSDLTEQYEAMVDGMQPMNDTETMLPLPARKVLFVGGHVNLINHMRPRHPEWTFLDGNSNPPQSFPQADICFVWTGHMAHKVWHKLKRELPKNVPILFLASTNQDMLEHEMCLRYNMWAKNQDIV